MKWEGIAFRGAVDRGCRDCPLCDLFITEHCYGCPIRARTNRRTCKGTPYLAFCKATSFDDRKVHDDASAEAALDMLNFLKGLLP